MSVYRHSFVIVVIAIAAVAGIIVTRLPAQTTSSEGTVVDNPPVITLSVQSANAQVAGFRPGVRAYYSTTVTDDKTLKSVIVTTSQMMYSSSPIDMYQCTGKASCEEKVYIIIPSNPGAQFVTVTATDDAGQVSTKTVNFDAPACTTDTDCGSSTVQWAGASYCGSEVGSGLETDIMQYGVAGTCKAGGICDTPSLPRVKQKCAAGQVCTYGSNGALCIAQAPACTVGAQITSVCTCGNPTLNYPYDWRVSTPTYCCSGSNGSLFTTSPGPCPIPVAPALPSSSPPSSPATGSTTSSPQTGGTAESPATVPSGSPSTPVSSGLQSPALSVPSVTVPSHPSAPVAPSKMTAGEQMHGVAGEGKQPNVAGIRRELQFLKSQGKQTRTKIASIEKNIASLEKKIDAKLRLLDRVKKAEVQRRVSVQIDGWQKKIDGLEVQKEKLEITMEGLWKSFEQLKAAAEEQ